MDNLTVRALSEEMAYIKGYTDALGEINGKRRRKQEQQKKKSEHRAKVAAGRILGVLEESNRSGKPTGTVRDIPGTYYLWYRSADKCAECPLA